MDSVPFRRGASAQRVPYGGYLDYFSDHSMLDYIAPISGHYEDDLSGNPIKTPKHIPTEE